MPSPSQEQVDQFFVRMYPGRDWDPARTAELNRREFARRRAFPVPDVTDPLNPSNQAMRMLKGLEAVSGRMNSPGRDLYADVKFPAPNSALDQLRTLMYKLGLFYQAKPSFLRTGL